MKSLELLILLIIVLYLNYSNSFNLGSISKTKNNYSSKLTKCKVDYLPYRKITKLNSALSISLDRSLLPSSKFTLNKFSLLTSLLVIGIISLYNFVQSEDSDNANPLNFIFESLAYLLSINKFLFSMDLLTPFKSLIVLVKESLKNKFKAKKTKSLNLEIWNVCKLTKIENLGEDYSKYRFDLQSYPDSIMSLDIGQQLQLCSVDPRGKTLKEGFVPISVPNSKGYFEILVRNQGFISGTPFSLALQYMSVGDEIAVKAGKKLLKYRGQDDPITEITLIASDAGIANSYRILNEILTDNESTVEQIDLLWINEKKTDFVLNDDIESLEIQHPKKLKVTRVVDTDVNSPDTLINDQLKDIILPHKVGAIVITTAPDVIKSKTCRLLQETLGYPPTNMIDIITL